MLHLKKNKDISFSDLKDLFEKCSMESKDIIVFVYSGFKKASHVVSIYDNKKLIGVIRSCDDSSWSANIDFLLVSKDYRNKGIGTRLVKELLKDIGSIFYITVATDKKLIPFYEKFGFIENGISMQIKRPHSIKNEEKKL